VAALKESIPPADGAAGGVAPPPGLAADSPPLTVGESLDPPPLRPFVRAAAQAALDGFEAAMAAARDATVAVSTAAMPWSGAAWVAAGGGGDQPGLVAAAFAPLTTARRYAARAERHVERLRRFLVTAPGVDVEARTLAGPHAHAEVAALVAVAAKVTRLAGEAARLAAQVEALPAEARPGATGAAPAAAPPGDGDSDGNEWETGEEEEEEGEEEGTRAAEAAATPSAAAAPPPPPPTATPPIAASSPPRAAPPSPPPATPAAWPAFDVLDTPAPPDHAFYSPAPPRASSRAWARAISREWGALKDGLPSGTAWVRTWEGRMDLARFALAGAPGTPYHDHLFLFDASFPPDYPASPPRLAYHAYGVRVNPNLYACGKVCLSLLGTWAGTRPGEAWEAGRSTLLQVVVSLQGLVLTAEPYYQEAGYEKQQKGGGEGGGGGGGGAAAAPAGESAASEEAAKNARLYAESAFLASARTGLGLLCKPPAPFGPLIDAHYRDRGGAYLKACAAYVAGTVGIGGRVEGVDEGAGGSSTAAAAAAAAVGPALPPPTEGFRLMLKGLVPALEAAFAKLG